MQLQGAGANLIPTGLTRNAPVANAAHGNSIQFNHVANVTMNLGHGHGTKQQMIQHAAAIVGVPGGAAFHYCEYGAANDYDGLGFVWGRLRGNGDWKFYLHYIAPAAVGGHGNQIGNTKWATV